MSDQELGITESKEHSTGEWYAEVVQLQTPTVGPSATAPTHLVVD